ncbi:uncharacterized protein METZ01_LOCUS308539, partial [marine metagenome]
LDYLDNHYYLGVEDNLFLFLLSTILNQLKFTKAHETEPYAYRQKLGF